MAGTIESNPRLRPLGVGELLDAAIKVCTANAGTLFRIVLVVIVPIQLLSLVILASTFPSGDTLSFSEADLTATVFAGLAAVWLLSLLQQLLSVGACFHAVAEAWLGRKPRWRESVKFALRRAPSLLWISVLYGLATLLGLIACILPGIWVAVIFSVAFPVLFAEDVRGSSALGRSHELIKDRWWSAFALLLVGFLLTIVIGFIIGLVFGLVTAASDSFAFLLGVNSLSGGLADMITTPFVAAIVTVLYFDLRVRKEGFDLEMLAERLSGGAPLARGAAVAQPAGGGWGAAPGAGSAQWEAPQQKGAWERPGGEPATPASPPAPASAADDANRTAEQAFGHASESAPAEPPPSDPPPAERPDDEPEEPPRWIPPGSGGT